mgnify:CR=1 FL=1
MEFEGLRRNCHTLNLTPLIDIVFLLLVFFMLTAHFVRDESIAIELPQAESSEQLSDEEVLEVVVNTSGDALINAKPVSPAALEVYLRNELVNRKNKTVRLRGDRQADLGKAISVLDAARKAGADAVDIITLKP